MQDVADSCRTGAAEMAGMSHRILERIDALDATGNTAAIGKVPNDYLLWHSFLFCSLLI